MADDTLAWFRLASISATNAARVMSRSLAISFKLSQNSSSMLTLVLCPAMTIERFETRALTACPRKGAMWDWMIAWLFGQEARALGANGRKSSRCWQQATRGGRVTPAVKTKLSSRHRSALGAQVPQKCSGTRKRRTPSASDGLDRHT